MMPLGWFLVALGGATVVASIVLMFVTADNLPLWPIFVTGGGVAVLILGAVLLDVAKHEDCVAKGGHEVPDGPPTYVMAGKVLVPVQHTRCETGTNH